MAKKRTRWVRWHSDSQSGLDGTQIANQGAGFTSSCLLEASAIYNKNVCLPLYEKMNLSFDIRRSENGWRFPTFFKWVNIIFFAGIIIISSFIWKWRINGCFTVGCGIWHFSFLGFTFTFITEKIKQVFCMSLFKMASLISFKCGRSCGHIQDMKKLSITGAGRLKEWISSVATRDVWVTWPPMGACPATVYGLSVLWRLHYYSPTFCFVPGERKPLHFLKIPPA